MQFARPKVKALAQQAVASITAAPLMAALAVASIVITLVVVLETMHDGRLPATGSIGLVCAVVLAAAAVAEASRPARSERARRRIVRPAAPDEAVADDVSIASRWR